MNLKNDAASVEILNIVVNIPHASLISSARLVYINGKGKLRVKSEGWSDNCSVNINSHLTLNDIPLVQINSPLCPTCKSILATGHGIANSNCAELNDIQEKINASFVSLEDSITSITPLLSLLSTGLYIIADTLCYPTDGNENFFWNTPNEPTENDATAGILFPENDYAYVSGHPVFLYPTQDTSCYSEQRVNYYIDVMKNNNIDLPRSIVYNFSEFISCVLDGHHKASAATILKKPLNCIAIIPYSGFRDQDVKGIQTPSFLVFSDIEIPISSVPKSYVPDLSKIRNEAFEITTTTGVINNRQWEKEYLDSAKSYPTVYEYADTVSVMEDIDLPISDDLIKSCLDSLNDECQQILRGIINILQRTDTAKMRCVAMICATKAPHGSLKKRAIQVLSEIKNDDEIEQIFIDYLVDNDEDTHDDILLIINAYWS